VVCSGPINTSLITTTTTSTTSSTLTTTSTAPYTLAGYHHHCDHYNNNNNNNKRTFRYQNGGLSRTRRTREWHHQWVGGRGVVNKQECTRNNNEGVALLVRTSRSNRQGSTGAHCLICTCPFSFSARSLPYPTNSNAPVWHGVDPTCPNFACHPRGLTASLAMAYYTLSLIYTCLLV